MAKRHIVELEDLEAFKDVARAWVENSSSDHAFAIIGGTLAENCLEMYMKSKMTDLRLTDGRTVFANLFEGTGPLSSFSGKNNAAHSFGLIGPKLFGDMETIRVIRNTFAHRVYTAQAKGPKPVILSFTSTEIIAQLKTLRTGNVLAELIGTDLTELDENEKVNGQFGNSALTIAMLLWLAVRRKGSLAEQTLSV